MTLPADAPAWLRDVLTDLGRAQAEAERQLAMLAGAQQATAAQIAALAAAQTRSEDRLDQHAERLDRLDALQAQLVAVQQQMHERFSGIETRLGGIDRQLDQLVVTQQQMAALLARHDERLDRIEGRFDDIDRTLDRHTAQLGGLTGRAWEADFRARAHSYLGDLVRRLRVLTHQERDDRLNAGVAAGHITEDQAEDVRRADFVCTARDPANGAAIVVVVEVSAGVKLRDVERVARRAQTRTRLGTPAIGVVAGARLDRDAAAAAAAAGVRTVIDPDA